VAWSRRAAIRHARRFAVRLEHHVKRQRSCRL
jgi:hypothetical protein